MRKELGCLKGDLVLEKEEINKFEGLTLNPGIVDAIIALSIQFFFIFIISVIHPPIFPIIKTNPILVIGFFCLISIPILIISLIDIVNNYKKIKSKEKDKKFEGYRLISALSFYMIPLLFLIYLPTNLLEFYLWIITGVALYFGFGKDRFPLIKYSIELFHFPSNKLYFNKKIVKNVIPSVYCLNIALWIVLLAVSLKFYPVPFLLLYYAKYIIQRKYFSDFSSEDFYKNWNKAERLFFNIFKIEILTFAIVGGIAYGLAY